MEHTTIAFSINPTISIITLGTMTALLLSFLWAAGVACASALDGEAARLLLAVGDVAQTSARVLIDAPQPASDVLHLRVFRSADSASAGGNGEVAFVLDRNVAVDMAGGDQSHPRAVQLDHLRPSTRYVVEFRWSGDAEDADAAALAGAGDQLDRVRFRTAPDGAEEEDVHVLAVSCDRFVDDHDDALWLELARDAERSPTHFGVAHVGDQVYVDAGDARIPLDPLPIVAISNATAVAKRYRRLVDAFRVIYRATFGRPVLQRVLRLGAHWMLPDDHEVANNLNRERVSRAFQGLTNASLPSDERALLFELTLHYRAGLQVFYEFQYQLQRDVPWSSVDFLSQPLDEIVRALPMHFSVQVGALRLFFLDARFDRAFLHDEQTSNTQLIGPAQRDALASALQAWRQERDDGSNVVPVVLSNLPLFFHSSLSAGIAYMVEKETYPGLAEQRAGLEDLFELLVGPKDASASSDAPTVRLLVGGDVHMMAHSRVCDSSTSRCVDQLITSGVTNGSTTIEDVKLIPFYVLITRLTPVVDLALDCLASLVPQSVIDQVDAIFHRAPWRVSFDWVFLGRNYG